MPIDVGILGFILTLLAPGLVQFESLIFNFVEPKEVGPSLEIRAEKILSKLVSKIFQEMDDDVVRSTLSRKAKDAAVIASLLQKRQSVAQQLGEDIWKEATKYQKIKDCYISWSEWVVRGRFNVTVWSFAEFLLFLLLTVVFFTGVMPLVIQNYYYWIAFFIVVVPLVLIFSCWLVASNWKRKYERLSENTM